VPSVQRVKRVADVHSQAARPGQRSRVNTVNSSELWISRSARANPWRGCTAKGLLSRPNNTDQHHQGSCEPNLRLKTGMHRHHKMQQVLLLSGPRAILVAVHTDAATLRVLVIQHRLAHQQSLSLHSRLTWGPRRSTPVPPARGSRCCRHPQSGPSPPPRCQGRSPAPHPLQEIRPQANNCRGVSTCSTGRRRC